MQDLSLILAAGGGSGDGLDAASYLGIVLVLGVVSQWLAYKIRVPSILLLLSFGFGLGFVANPDELIGTDMLFAVVGLSVGIVLFEGGLSLKIKELRESAGPVFRLCTLTWMIAWPLQALAATLLGFDWRLSTMVGAILVVTGPTVVGPILRAMKPSKQVNSMVKWEGILVDPIGAILGLLVFQAILNGSELVLETMLGGLALTLVVGFGISLVLGFVLEQLMKRHAIPDFLHGVVFLAVAGGAFVLSNKIQPESGLLTVTVLGIWLANRKGYDLDHVIEFKEHLRTLLIGALFIVLAGRVDWRDLVAVLPQALGFLAILVLIVRPASIFGGLLGSKTSLKERVLLASLAPRGIVAAAVTSIFALEFLHVSERDAEKAQAALEAGDMALHEELLASAQRTAELAEGAEGLVPLVFLVIVGTVLIYGLSATPLARRLGLATTNPQGVLFAGASQWVVQTAKLLREMDFQATVVDSNYQKLSQARMAGVPTVTANILSEYAVEDMDFSGMGKMIAATPNDEVNATAGREFSHHFGRANVFQLGRSKGAQNASVRREAADHLSARQAFIPALPWVEMERRSARGMVVKRTPLSENFTLKEFLETRGEDTVIMFVIREGKLQVAHPEMKLPEDEGTLVALVPAENEQAENQKRAAEAERKAEQKESGKAKAKGRDEDEKKAREMQSAGKDGSEGGAAWDTSSED